jgi:hypothetical protein
VDGGNNEKEFDGEDETGGGTEDLCEQHDKGEPEGMSYPFVVLRASSLYTQLTLLG